MNAMLPHGGKVHAMRDGAPRCGGGRHGKRGPWQMDMGDVTCLRCRKIELRARSETQAQGAIVDGH